MAAETSVIPAADVVAHSRWDAEAFAPELRQLEVALRDAPPLRDVATVTHPGEITRIYTDDAAGVRFLLAANIRPVLPNLARVSLIPPDVAEGLPTNRLETGDVLVTRTGAFHGVACAFLGESGTYFTSGEGLIVRPRPEARIDGAYLAAFLGSTYGYRLCRKAAYGSGQPHTGPGYLRGIPVLRMGRREAAIARRVREAWTKSQHARPKYYEAQQLMLDYLGWKPALPPRIATTYDHRFNAAGLSGRWDAEFFSPRSAALRRLLDAGGATVRDIAAVREERFVATAGQPFNYIQIGDIGDGGSVGSTSVRGEDAPDRAQFFVREGDVVTSTVRPVRRLSAIISKEQDGFVCSNGFAVLVPREVEPEILLAYLRLPPVCELMELYTTATMYPAIAVGDLMGMPVKIPPEDVREEIVSLIREARTADGVASRLVGEAVAEVDAAVEALL